MVWLQELAVGILSSGFGTDLSERHYITRKMEPALLKVFILRAAFILKYLSFSKLEIFQNKKYQFYDNKRPNAKISKFRFELEYFRLKLIHSKIKKSNFRTSISRESFDRCKIHSHFQNLHIMSFHLRPIWRQIEILAHSDRSKKFKFFFHFFSSKIQKPRSRKPETPYFELILIKKSGFDFFIENVLK